MQPSVVGKWGVGNGEWGVKNFFAASHLPYFLAFCALGIERKRSHLGYNSFLLPSS